MKRLKLAAATILSGLTLGSAAVAATCQNTVASPCEFLSLADTGILYFIDNPTGQVVPLTFAAGSAQATNLIGLGQLNSTYYAESSTDQLYSLTITSNGGTGAGITGSVFEKAIGPAQSVGTSFVDFGSTRGGLYAIGANGDLYSISRTNGQAMQIGSGLGDGITNLSSRTVLGQGGKQVADFGMSTASGTLYFIDSTLTTTGTGKNAVTTLTTTLYYINTTSGKAFTIASNAVTVPKNGKITNDWGALTLDNGTLYAGANDDGTGSHGGLYSVNQSNAVTTFINEASPNPGNRSPFYGMIPWLSADVLPEPSEWALMLVGIGAVGGALRARRRKAAVEA